MQRILSSLIAFLLVLSSLGSGFVSAFPGQNAPSVSQITDGTLPASASTFGAIPDLTPTESTSTPLPPDVQTQTPVSSLESTSTPEVPSSTTEVTPTVETITETTSPEVETSTPEPQKPAALTLNLSVDNELLMPGETFYLQWEIINLDPGVDLTTWVLVFTLPEGFFPVDETLGKFNSGEHTFTLPAQAKGTIDWMVSEDSDGEQTLHVQLVQGQKLQAQTSLRLAVGGETSIGTAGGEATGLNGKVKVKVPAGALSEAAQVRIRKPKTNSDIPHQKNWQPVELLAKAAASQAEIHNFAEPIELEMTYDESTLDGDASTLTWFTWDSEKGWVALPSQVDLETHTVHGWTEHFSLFNLDTQSWLAAKIPPLDAAQVAPFTGAASYSIPIEVPAGPGGLTPSISLSYNSNVIDGASNQSQASWTGMGWSLNAGGMIRRDLNKAQRWDGDDVFTLTLGAGTYSLVPVAHYPSNGTTQYIDYKATADNFWLIRRYVSRAAIDGDYLREYDTWEVWDSSGNRYTFSTRAYYLEYYDNQHETMRAWAWYLTTQSDLEGKSLTYYYDMDERSIHIFNGATAWVEMGVYLKDIVYPDNHTRIRFVKEMNRTDYNPEWDGDNQEYFYVLHERSRLAKIQILQDPVITYRDNTYSQYSGRTGYNMVDETNDNSILVREYQLNYFADIDNGGIFRSSQFSSTHAGKVLTLSSIQEFGTHAQHNAVNPVFVMDHTDENNLPHLPKITFAYGDGMHLTQVQNGQGGVVDFTYEASLNPPTPWVAGIDTTQSSSAGPWPYPSGRIWPDRLTLVDSFTTFRPGAGYTLQCNIVPFNSGQLITGVRFRLEYVKNNPNTAIYSGDLTLTPLQGEMRLASWTFTLPKDTSQAIIYIQKASGYDGNLDSCTVYPLLTRYRVATKSLNPGIGTSSQFTYQYFNPAANTAAGYTDPYRPANSEFRGHSEVVETGPADSTGHQRVVHNYFYQDDIYSGQSWKTTTIDLPSGKILAETNHSLTNTEQSRDTTIPGDVTFQICARKSDSTLTCYPDRRVYWVYPAAEESKTYGTDGITYLGTKREYEYLPADQGNYAANAFGNRTRIKELVWTGSTWLAKRATRILFNPRYVSSSDPSAVVYLVGLPQANEAFACPSGNCTYSLTDLAAFACSVYTSGGICSLASSGVVTIPQPASNRVYARRTLLRFAAAGFSDPRFQDEAYDYDIWGNQTYLSTHSGEGNANALSYGPGQATTTIYDGAYHTRITQTQVQTFTQTPPISYITQYGYTSNGDVFGLPTSETDPNGLVTQAGYDELGRLVSLDKPTNTDTTSTHSLAVEGYHDWVDATHPHYIQVTQKVADNISITSLYFSDGWGRGIETQTLGATLKLPDQPNPGIYSLVTKAAFDVYGRNVFTLAEPKATTNLAGFDSVPLAQDNSIYDTYDALGRKLSKQSPDMTTTSQSYEIVSYNGEKVLQTIAADAKGYFTTTLTDAFGQVVKVTPPGGNPAISFGYDVVGHLTSIQQPLSGGGSATTLLTYDLAGRKISMRDPDMGGGSNKTWTYQYDAAGNLVKQLDAKGTALCQYYDQINRLIGKAYPADGNCTNITPPYLYTYDYDETSHTYRDEDESIQSLTFQTPKGKRTSMHDPSGSTYWNYDAKGRLVQEIHELAQVALGTYKVSYAYFTNSEQVQILTYPADSQGRHEKIQFTLNDRGRVSSVASIGYVEEGASDMYYAGGSASSFDPVIYDPQGRLVKVRLGNNRLETYGYYELNPEAENHQQGGRLKTITVDTLLNLTYTYDPNGNITSLSDLIEGIDERGTYLYDEMNRLTSASMPQTAITAGYELRYAFDPVTGNLTSVTIPNLSMKEYTFDPQHPHAVVQAGQDIYGYDDNGNMTSRSEGGVTYTQNWTKDNRLKQITWGSPGSMNQTLFVYDGDGNRVLKIETSPDLKLISEITTVYIGQIYEIQLPTTDMATLFGLGE